MVARKDDLTCLDNSFYLDLYRCYSVVVEPLSRAVKAEPGREDAENGNIY